MDQQNDIIQTAPPNQEEMTSPAEEAGRNVVPKSPDAKTIPSSDAEKDEQIQNLSSKGSGEQYRVGVGFLLFLLLNMFIIMMMYSLAHGINYLQIYTNPNSVFKVDFIGGGRNLFSMAFEVSMWAFLGVTCRMSYTALKAMNEGSFRFWKYTATWLGTIGFAWGVSVALIFSLSVLTLNIGTTKITLADAPLETIIAIAFIIGFYNEQALRLLERVRDKLTAGIESESPTNKP